MAVSEANKRAAAKYHAANIVQVKLQLNRKTDADILEHLAKVGNKAGYIKSLIRNDLKNTLQKP